MDIAKLHKNYALCEKHFEAKYISKGGTRKTLFAEAVPTVFKYIAGQVATERSAKNINLIKNVVPVEASHALLGWYFFLFMSGIFRFFIIRKKESYFPHLIILIGENKGAKKTYIFFKLKNILSMHYLCKSLLLN